MEDQILDAKEVAKRLRVSITHVYNLLNGDVEGIPMLPHIPLGRKKVVRLSSFEKWIEENEKRDMTDPVPPSNHTQERRTIK